jgi:D-alanyl-D-alanine carboxypeptidase
MKTKTILSTLISFCIAVSAITAQSFNNAKEDSLLNLLLLKNKAMGSLAVSENGNIIYTKAIGIKESTPAMLPSDEKTKYRIGSISKMFTATLIFKMIDEGKISLGTTLDKFFPSVPNASNVTIGHMLSHRSGIHSITNDSLYMTYMLQPKTRQEMVDMISATKSDFEPDAKTEYSNSNFVLLGYIVEDLYKKPYNEILQEVICKKAGLSDTYYGGKIDPARNESHSYRYLTSWEKLPETDMSIPHGAGAIISTPTDLVKFIYALFNGQMVSESSLSHMITIQDASLGMGMMQIPYEDKKVFGHGGAIDGFNSLLCYFPEEKLAVSYISNGSNYSVNDIVLRTMNNYFGKYDKLPEFRTYAVKDEDLDQYLGVYVSSQIPIKVTITKKDGNLFGQGSGQPEIALEAIDKDKFKFDPAGIVMIFHPAQNDFILEQGGGTYTFTRE